MENSIHVQMGYSLTKTEVFEVFSQPFLAFTEELCNAEGIFFKEF